MGRHYSALWDGRTIPADEIMHVRNLSETCAPERMAALYFFWDDERQATVVTAGPAKLETAADYT